MKVEVHSHDFFLARSCCIWQNSVYQCTVMVKSSLLSTLSAFLLPGMSQTLPSVVLVNHSVWVDQLVMYKALQSKKIGNMHVTFISTRPHCSRMEKIGFFIGRTCVWCLSDSIHGFCLLLWPIEKVSVISDFVHLFLEHKYILLLLA
jgi:hypothetical protein